MLCTFSVANMSLRHGCLLLFPCLCHCDMSSLVLMSISLRFLLHGSRVKIMQYAFLLILNSGSFPVYQCNHDASLLVAGKHSRCSFVVCLWFAHRSRHQQHLDCQPPRWLRFRLQAGREEYFAEGHGAATLGQHSRHSSESLHCNSATRLETWTQRLSMEEMRKQSGTLEPRHHTQYGTTWSRNDTEASRTLLCLSHRVAIRRPQWCDIVWRRSPGLWMTRSIRSFARSSTTITATTRPIRHQCHRSEEIKDLRLPLITAWP